MPGVLPDDVDVRFEKGELTVHGRDTGARGQDRASLEYEAGSYFRTFRFAEHIAADRIQAELKNGVLTLHLPKVEAVKPRRISVRGQAAGNLGKRANSARRPGNGPAVGTESPVSAVRPPTRGFCRCSLLTPPATS